MLFGKIEVLVTLATTANNTVVATNLTDVLDEEAFLISVKATWSIRSLTAGEGPLLVGLAHSDYTAAEVEEWVENTGSWERGNMVQQEIARRKIRQVGVFDGQSATEKLENGVKITTPCKWGLITGDSIKFWVYNKSGAALTTGAFVSVDGMAFLRPR